MKAVTVLALLVVCLLADSELTTAPTYTVDYPIRLTYINRVTSWWPPERIAASLGVPGYSPSTLYNYVVLTFWTCKNGPLDAVSIWADPLKYFGGESPFGKDKASIQKNLKARYNEKGIKIMISAFGATEFPTTIGVDAVTCATDLATFVSQNNLDGVDLDWEDNDAMENSTGQAWLVAFTKKLRQKLPNHIISHAPQAPYFCSEHYKKGAYITVDKSVGHLIDFYNIQFYNQGDTTYDTYEKLFIKSTGFFNKTSVKEINDRGVPLEKLVIGKPVTPGDATNTGYMEKTALGNAITKAVKESQWKAGVFFWQYSSDPNGDTIHTVVQGLMQG